MCAQETPIELRQSAVTEMSSKLSESDQRYKSLGFERTFDGSAGGIQWSELIEELKTTFYLAYIYLYLGTVSGGERASARTIDS